MNEILNSMGVGNGFGEVMLAGAGMGLIVAVIFVSSYLLMMSGIRKLSAAVKRRKSLISYCHEKY